MRATLAVISMLCAGCGGSRTASVDQEVRAFAAEVARDVSRDGPAAWDRHFAQDPAFFLAANGELQFANRAAAAAATPKLMQSIQHIRLDWSELRVDPLGPDMALMAASFHENIASASGQTLDAKGYFTGIVERRDGRWGFRNAHWSVPVPSAEIR